MNVFSASKKGCRDFSLHPFLFSVKLLAGTAAAVFFGAALGHFLGAAGSGTLAGAASLLFTTLRSKDTSSSGKSTDDDKSKKKLFHLTHLFCRHLRPLKKQIESGKRIPDLRLKQEFRPSQRDFAPGRSVTCPEFTKMAHFFLIDLFLRGAEGLSVIFVSHFPPHRDRYSRRRNRRNGSHPGNPEGGRSAPEPE